MPCQNSGVYKLAYFKVRKLGLHFLPYAHEQHDARALLALEQRTLTSR
jgi:hypothetical protein